MRIFLRCMINLYYFIKIKLNTLFFIIYSQKNYKNILNYCYFDSSKTG